MTKPSVCFRTVYVVYFVYLLSTFHSPGSLNSLQEWVRLGRSHHPLGQFCVCPQARQKLCSRMLSLCLAVAIRQSSRRILCIVQSPCAMNSCSLVSSLALHNSSTNATQPTACILQQEAISENFQVHTMSLKVCSLLQQFGPGTGQVLTRTA